MTSSYVCFRTAVPHAERKPEDLVPKVKNPFADGEFCGSVIILYFYVYGSKSGI